MDFDAAFTRLVDPQHEGGYSNNPVDPGGETKYGISKRAYPNVDIASLTLDDAKAIYRRDYWTPAACDQWPELLRYEVFDLAVNVGVSQAIRLVQRALAVSDDGIVGPKTLAAAQAADPQTALRRLQALRLQFYTARPAAWRAEFLAGVVNRVAVNMLGV